MGTPFRESNDEEKALMQDTVDRFGKRFAGLVEKHRNPDPTHWLKSPRPAFLSQMKRWSSN
jgi:ClpP class serine protease